MRSPRLRLRASIHVRLAVLYTALFLAAGAALLAVNYSLLDAQLPHEVSAGWVSGVTGNSLVITSQAVATALPAASIAPGADTATVSAFAVDVSNRSVAAFRSEALGQLVQQSLVALALMAIVAVVLGWFVARRVLRPVHAITAAARRLGEGSLDERLAVSGPHDELRELGETFNAMLDRLQSAFRRERRLMANVSHELRTPLANQRLALEVGLADAAATVPELRRLGETALAQNLRSQQLIERLLLLASAEEASHQTDEVIDLAATVHGALSGLAAAGLDTSGLDLQLALAPTLVRGDAVLLERLVGNLIENAVRYNVPRGWVSVRTDLSADGRLALIEVSNSGPLVPPEAVVGLFEPFRRQHGDRVRSDAGVGLGLAIVTAIVRRHGGTVDARAGEAGGLTVRVTLPSSGHLVLADERPAVAAIPGAGQPQNPAR